MNLKCPLKRYKWRFRRCHPCDGTFSLRNLILNKRGSVCRSDHTPPTPPLPPMPQIRVGIEWAPLEYPELLDLCATYHIEMVRTRYTWSDYYATKKAYVRPWDSLTQDSAKYYAMTKSYIEHARKLGIWVHINMFKSQTGFAIPGWSPEEYSDGAWQQLYDPTNHHLLQHRAHKLTQVIGHPDNVILELFCEPEAREVNEQWKDMAHGYLRNVLMQELGWKHEQISTNGNSSRLGERSRAGEYYSFHWTPREQFAGLNAQVLGHGCKRAIFSTDGKDVGQEHMVAEKQVALSLGSIYAWWNSRWGDYHPPNADYDAGNYHAAEYLEKCWDKNVLRLLGA